jgi:spermidine synthase
MSGRVVGIEKDHQVLALASKYFKSTYLEDVDVLAMDAAEFMQIRKECFDLVVCDVFVNKDVPESVQTAMFVSSLIEATNPGGIGYFNFIAETVAQRGQLDRLVKHFDALSVSLTILKFSSVNHILVWKKAPR